MIPTSGENSKFSIYNHFNIHIHYHQKDASRARIVGVVINPQSLDTETQHSGCVVHDSTPKQYLDSSATSDTSIAYTYNVYWEKDTVAWGTRWDHYLHVFDPKIHWFSIVNSIVIVLILASMVSMILLRALKRDISRYNTLGDEDGAQEEFGWKLVHADVFRPPAHRMLLSVLIGNGIQILCMGSVTLGFAVLGFLSPSSRGSLGTMALIFYILFSSVSGYVSSVTYKTLQGEHWRRNVMLAAFLIPGIIFGILLTLNFILIGRQSSSAVPFGTLVALVALWFLVSIPLCVVGAYFGFKHPGFEHPCKTNQIPRQIPPQVISIDLALVSQLCHFGLVGRYLAFWSYLH